MQTARIRVTVDSSVQMDELHGDGLIIATGAGSTAYNRSAGGPVLPLTAQLLTVTPVAAFHPRSWRGALLPSDAEITPEILDSDNAPSTPPPTTRRSPTSARSSSGNDPTAR